MELQLVEVKDLQEGDEILISCQSCFKYLRVLRKPTLNGQKHWNTGAPLYKAVKCSSHRSATQISYISINNGQPIYYNEYKWELGPENHNITQYINLEGRQILLINRNKK